MGTAKSLEVCVMSACLLMLTACSWTAKISKKAGQPVEGEISASGDFFAPRLHAGSAISASDLYIDTSGTDFSLAYSGNVALTLTDAAGGVIAARAFQWVRSGRDLVFQDPSAVQGWLNQYPSAASVGAKLSYGNTPADGVDHVMTTAVVYQGRVQAAVTQTFAAECMTRYHTRGPCPR